jgi:hypothetical protein
MKCFMFAFFLLWGGSVSAQFAIQTAKSAGMGQAITTIRDVNSLFGNQAGLAFLKHFSAIATAERRFSMSELQTVASGVAFPTRSGTFGVVVQSFGFEAFRQQKLGFSYARLLSGNFAIGAQFDYLQTRIREYGNKGALTFEVGLQAVVSKNIVVGTHVFSPAPVEWVAGENFPTLLRMGLSWLPNDKSVLVFELEKDTRFPLRVKGGFEYNVTDSLWLRAGFGTQPVTFNAGVGIRIQSKLRTDVAGSYHQVLGFSPAASVVYYNW